MCGGKDRDSPIHPGPSAVLWRCPGTEIPTRNSTFSSRWNTAQQDKRWWTGEQTPSSCLSEFVLRSLMSSRVCLQFSYVFLSLSSILLCLPRHGLGPLISSRACLAVPRVFLDWIQHEKLITPGSDIFNVYLSHYSYTLFRGDLCLFNNRFEQSPQWCKVTKTTLRPWTCALNSVSAVLQTNSRGRPRSDFQFYWNVHHAWLPFKGDFSRVSRWKTQLSSHLLGLPSTMDGLCLPVRMTTWAGGSFACNWPRSPIQIKPRPTAGLFKGTTKDSLLPGRILLFPVGFGSGQFGSSRQNSVLPGRIRFGRIRLFPAKFGSSR